MKLAILGGGGFRVPLVHGQVLGDERITQVSLHDTDSGRLEAMEHVLAGQAAASAGHVERVATARLDEALDGADFVFSAIRVGGLSGRVADEQVALAHGVLGQETTGAGGIAYGLRTVPVALGVAETAKRVCPGAWVVNFTNPAGMVTQAMRQVLGDQVVGICDSPIGLAARCARALGLGLGEVRIDYAGLNHLGWLRGLQHEGRDVLPGLLASPERLGFEEGRLFGAEWLAELGSVPNEYLHYYYFAREALAAIRDAGATRGQFLLAQQGQFYDDVRARPVAAYEEWVRVRTERDQTYMAESRDTERDAEDVAGGGYERVALALMNALAGGDPATLILNVPAPGVAAGLAPETVMEVPCDVAADGVRPLPVTPLRGHELGLVQQVSASYAATIEAAITGSPTTAVRAFADHPLVDGVGVARQLVRAYRDAIPELAEVLAPLR